MSLLKHLISFIYPIKIKTIASEHSGALEVTLVNGKLVIDSENANYSFGSLQQVLKKSLLFLGKQNLEQIDNILVLGVAGGSVIQTIRHDFNLKAQITGVEIDPDIIELANTYFQLHETENFELITADAFQYIHATTLTFDLIIVDLFNDTQMPKKLFDGEFWKQTHKLLNDKGLVVFNTIYNSNEDLIRNKHLKNHLSPIYTTVSSLKTNRVNEVILLKK